MISSLTTYQGIIDVFVMCLAQGKCVLTKPKGDLGLGLHPLADVPHPYLPVL